ncbi:F5/8 type C domain-containing protein [Motilibacter rhizosphaerae]|uniref:F5/8 type C domain-containing protein n=1 Tax=Motilibacter rhizosphaerae TaxID=598652 RepID=A0A4Q7NA26_9ACTN|nr:discoidin domain-containing protein [Motilibacter rhizosphaerae]RZS79025.1 F5/8 type C domain-containing protein [Motilibacter rhizosphaerae]
MGAAPPVARHRRPWSGRGRTSRSRRTALALALLLLAPLLSVVSTGGSAHAADALLSQGKTATASSTENAGSAAANAVDGNTGTRWSSAFSDPQWLQVDLGATATVTSVTLQWEAAYAKAFQIQTSTDAATWTTVYSTTTSTGGTQTLNVTGTGRYIRMYGTARATTYGYSLWEFQVYGTTGTTGGGTCGTTNAAQGKTATASSTENAGTPASAAVDGNPGTRWSSAATDPQWIQIDLGTPQTLCQVVLQWEAAYAKAFQLQTSTDAATWTTNYSTTTGTGGTQTLTVTGTGRYLRIYGTTRATQYGYSLWEVQAYTTGSGGSSGSGDVELSYGKPASASSTQDDGNCSQCTPAKAVDQNAATRWATSAWSDPGWISVDLGATATIHSVVLQWDAAYATAYQVQVSNDGTTWTTIYATTTGKGFKETLTGLNGTGRYVRMFGTARGTAYGYSLWEFQVYGTGGSPTAPPAPAPNVALPATRLVFDDEFNGTAGTTPDPAKWTPETGTGPNGELEYYTNNKNATMDGTGDLVIEARKEVTAGSSCPRDTLSGSTTCQYTSGRINSLGKFSFTYGHAEARIKVSGTQGLWPAFWLLGANFPQVGWPASGEIDIMEHVGKVPGSVYSTLHAPAYNGGGGYGQPYSINGDFASAFHTYAVDWDATHMTFSVDGNAFFTADKAQIESTRGPWVYDHPFFIILNNAVGGDWPGSPDASTQLPQKMLVDYVRVYQ